MKIMDKSDLQLKVDDASIDAICESVARECKRATRLHGSMASPHEAKAVIEEELEELWDLIKATKHWGRDREARFKMRAEALQVAAMAVRFILDICK